MILETGSLRSILFPSTFFLKSASVTIPLIPSFFSFINMAEALFLLILNAASSMVVSTVHVKILGLKIV